MNPNKIIAALLEIARQAHLCAFNGQAPTLALNMALAELNEIPQPEGQSLTGPARAALALESFTTGAVVPFAVNLDEVFIDAIYTTAAEGGSNYWCDHWQPQRDDEADGDHVISASFHAEDEDDTVMHKTDAASLMDAVGKIMTDPALCRADIRESITRAVLEKDAGYIDAEGADVIIQIAALGSIVYG